MSKIKSKVTGDVFEAPATDFTNEVDFEVVDDSTPITLAAPPLGESPSTGTDSGTVLPTSLPVDTSDTGTSPAPVDATASVSTVSTSSPSTDVLGNGTAPTAGDASAPVAATGDVGEPVPAVNATTGATSGDAVSGTDTASGSPSGEVGNGIETSDAGSSTEVSNTSSDTEAADNATSVVNPGTPPTDSVNASPTGGPTPGNGATLDAKSKHLVAGQIEADVLFMVGQIVTVTPSLQHAAEAFFAQVTSQIDVEAVTG